MTARDVRIGALVAAVVAAAASALYLMGRAPICTCGTVKLWHGGALDAENSQHLADWYSPSHVVHGIILYGLLRLLSRASGRAWPPGAMFLVAVPIEAAWEVFENTPFIIDRYRTATIALGYTGDSIVNAVGDILAMVVGYALAARLPVAATVAVAVGLELVPLAVIRDNLTLNLLMLIWPLEAVRKWQEAAGAAPAALLPVKVVRQFSSQYRMHYTIRFDIVPVVYCKHRRLFMRKLIAWNVMSLDGRFEGDAPWQLDFHETVWGDELEAFSLEQGEDMDILVFGRRTYEGMAGYWSNENGPIADFMNAVDKRVASRTLKSVDWNNAHLIEGDVVGAIQALKQEDGKNVYVFGSADLLETLLAADLIDEYRICLAPVVRGSGTPLFKAGYSSKPLALLEARPLKTGGVLLRYGVNP